MTQDSLEYEQYNEKGFASNLKKKIIMQLII